MGPEVEDNEMKKYAVQQELMTLLDKKPETGLPLPRLSSEATIALDVDKGTHLYNFAELMAPKLRQAQVLDLFCGANSIKSYGREHNFTGQVTGVDIEDDKADIKADVAKIEQAIPPSGQFDIVVSSGAIPGVENYETSAKYLKPDGLYVMGASLEWMDKNVLPYINNPELMSQLSPAEQAEARKFLLFFTPVVVADTLHIPNVYGYDLNDSYLICHKRGEQDS
jgi:2-polyprenyl-3-methyl-5-hydroxy-6-metoxy-1,4-benzoquinol methylase